MKVKVSTSVGNFNDKVKKTWNIESWQGVDDEDKDVLFFGLYHEHDWNLYHHLGPEWNRTIFWCGSDITRLVDNPERQRILRLFPVEHYCETEEEAKELRSVGIEPHIIPSFLEDVNEFPVCYKHSETPHIWLNAHPEREEEYGVDVAFRMAEKFPTYTFHVYGLEPSKFYEAPNLIFHGTVPNEQFNAEIKTYQCGLRCNKSDGMSEIPIKSLLLGQYPITRMRFPEMWHYETEEELEELLKKLPEMKEPNLKAREYWITNLNNYPWCKKESL